MNDDLIAEVVRRVVERVDRAGRLEAVERAGQEACGCGTAASARATLPATWPPKRVAIGADHGGYPLKEDLVRFLKSKGFQVVDCGTHGFDSVDYPDFAAAVARQVRDGKCEAGVVIDGAGIGSGMAANKVAGVRCAVCHDVATILNSREHNDANVLSLGANVVSVSLARRMLNLWLSTACAGDRHLRRVKKIMEIES